MIREFNNRAFRLADDDTVAPVLPQFLFSLRFSKDDTLMKNLILRCTKHTQHTIKIFWYLVVETEREAQALLKDPLAGLPDGQFFDHMIYQLMEILDLSENGRKLKLILKKQGQLIEKLVEISGRIRQSRHQVTKKKQILHGILNDSPDLLLFDPMPLPIKCDTQVIGVVPDKCSVFHSQLNPLLLTFLAKEGKFLKCIFKTGDNLRQDAVVTQLLEIMKNILRGNSLSPKDIVTYKVMSTGRNMRKPVVKGCLGLFNVSLAPF